MQLIDIFIALVFFIFSTYNAGAQFFHFWTHCGIAAGVFGRCHSIRHAQPPIWAWMICYHATLEVIPRPFCVFYDVEGVTRWIIQCYIPRYAMEARVLLEKCMYFWRIVITDHLDS